MENASLLSDVWDNVTTSLSTSDDVANKIAYIRDRVLQIIYIILGALGIVDNLFVIAVFIFFIKITEKVQLPLEKFDTSVISGAPKICVKCLFCYSPFPNANATIAVQGILRLSEVCLY